MNVCGEDACGEHTENRVCMCAGVCGVYVLVCELACACVHTSGCECACVRACAGMQVPVERVSVCPWQCPGRIAQWFWCGQPDGFGQLRRGPV